MTTETTWVEDPQPNTQSIPLSPGCDRIDFYLRTGIEVDDNGVLTAEVTTTILDLPPEQAALIFAYAQTVINGTTDA